MIMRSVIIRFLLPRRGGGENITKYYKYNYKYIFISITISMLCFSKIGSLKSKVWILLFLPRDSVHMVTKTTYVIFFQNRLVGKCSTSKFIFFARSVPRIDFPSEKQPITGRLLHTIRYKSVPLPAIGCHRMSNQSQAGFYQLHFYQISHSTCYWLSRVVYFYSVFLLYWPVVYLRSTGWTG